MASPSSSWPAILGGTPGVTGGAGSEGARCVHNQTVTAIRVTPGQDWFIVYTENLQTLLYSLKKKKS